MGPTKELGGAAPESARRGAAPPPVRRGTEARLAAVTGPAAVGCGQLSPAPSICREAARPTWICRGFALSETGRLSVRTPSS
jgi:hypothetical protein